MTETEIEQILADGESDEIEFKRELDRKNAKSICKEIAAFASTKGGIILIGIDDDRKIIGVDKKINFEQRLSNLANAHVSPEPNIKIKNVDYKEKLIVTVSIRKSAAPIVYYDNKPFIRVGSLSQPANPQQVIDRITGINRKIEDLEKAIKEQNPNKHTAAAIYGQGQLATMNYSQLIEMLISTFPTLRNVE